LVGVSFVWQLSDRDGSPRRAPPGPGRIEPAPGPWGLWDVAVQLRQGAGHLSH